MIAPDKSQKQPRRLFRSIVRIWSFKKQLKMKSRAGAQHRQWEDRHPSVL
jgi:hypothetical protein